MKQVPELLGVLRSRRYIKELKVYFESLDEEGRQSKGRGKFQSSSVFLCSIFLLLQYMLAAVPAATFSGNKGEALGCQEVGVWMDYMDHIQEVWRNKRSKV